MAYQPNPHTGNSNNNNSRKGMLSLEMKAKVPFASPIRHFTMVSKLFLILLVVFLISNCIQMRSLDRASRIVLSTNSLHSMFDTPSFSDEEFDRTAVVTEAVSGNAETRHDETTTLKYIEIPKRKSSIQRNIVQTGDYIYYKDDESWDSAPIVMESHKLIFFTIPKVGCTVWKQLFRRMMNYSDWNVQDYDIYQPHNPQVNGLKYLYNYSLEEASIMMTSPEWTRAMMVRDPKQRYLSAFLDKAIGNFHRHIHDRCCPKTGDCIDDAQTIAGFVRLCNTCYDEHWRPQYKRIDYKYWPYIDHISHLETAATDVEVLLRKINAWEEYGSSGWGGDGTQSIFASKESNGAGMNHTTFAEYQIWKWYTPETEKLVEGYFQGDYENPLFQFRRDCLTCTD